MTEETGDNLNNEKLLKTQEFPSEPCSNSKTSESPAEIDSTPPRQKWSNKWEFIVSCIGYSIGFGNMWRFPYICYKNGGGAFLIPYFISVIFAGIPMFFLELSLGQYLSQGGISVWKISPAFKGVGFSMIMNVFCLNIYYIVVVAWSLYYLFRSFTTTLPWSRCDNPWNTPYCMSSYLNHTNSSFCFDNLALSNASNFPTNSSYSLLDPEDCLNVSLRSTPIKEFWELEVLKMSKGLHEPGAMNWSLTGNLVLAWIVCYFCIWKGVKWLGKVSWLTSTAPYVFLFILLLRGTTLPGAYDGIRYYLKPNFSKLLNPEVWNDALTQIFFSYGLVLGTQIALGSYNSYHNNVMKDALMISAINSCTSIFSGFVIFSVLGFMANQQGKLVKDVADSGPGLVFLAYPSAIAQMPLSPIWAILFFLTLFFVGLDSQFCAVEGFVTAFVDLWPHKLRRRKELVALLVCVVSLLAGLSMTTQGGIYVFELLNHYSASGIVLTIIIFFECIAISYGYGVDRYMKALEHMLQFSPGKWWKWCWLVMTPCACLLNIILAMVFYKTLEYQKYKYPFWSNVIGWFIMFSTLCFIPGFALYAFHKTSGSFRKRLKQICRPFVADEPVNNENHKETTIVL